MSALDKFVTAVIKSDSGYQEMDRIYVENKIHALVGDDDSVKEKDDQLLNLRTALIETAIKNGKIENSLSARNILDAELMDLITPLPSAINTTFWNLYQKSPKMATDYFYKISCDNNYIKTQAIAKNISFPVKSNYGDLEITINLSKPEKDPKAIAAAAKQKDQHSYPLDQLCLENEGYLGRVDYPARSNHRVIRLTLGGETWGFQYSPYAYFQEHSIFLSKIHRPMIINQHTFSNLLEIVRIFPEYFVGSNADLPIVGGSMLSHDHYQGGRHLFPMMKAKIDRPINFGVNGITTGIVKWPMSTIRLISENQEQLAETVNLIHKKWMNYSDKTVDVRAYTNGVRHHTVTPIVHFENGKYIFDVVLRDNQTSVKYPDGIFHPHQDVQHIKKENIGLIEVMGRAILPARLKNELKEVASYLLQQPNQMAAYHREWADQLKKQYNFTKDNVNSILDKEVGLTFSRVLEDAGVFKWDQQGQAAFNRFIESLHNN
ncbi:UDP-glucose--hexose-1-phosphate uridylyltransferase [Oenococcus sp. UCMA 16435]|nr:UDP-glucose--hexose-1-phosphate uridylyltransferase [Oenococcus sp. UCMA 16435]MDI4584555.1 UDP-glucose--hexose-1-phosphate uridylyltransferase [Oenococcus sp. UCMA 14587]